MWSATVIPASRRFLTERNHTGAWVLVDAREGDATRKPKNRSMQ